MKKLMYLAGAIASTIYLVNPTAGFLEILPDNLPFVGNLDEAFFTLLLLACLSRLGVQTSFLTKLKNGDK